MSTIYLGSSSPDRRKILENLGYNVIQVSPDVDETPVDSEVMSVYTERVSRAKASSAVSKLKKGPELEGRYVVCGDSVVFPCGGADGKFFQKPRDRDEAREFIKAYARDLKVGVYSCLIVVDLRSGREAIGAATNHVYFKPGFLSRSAAVEKYLDEVSWYSTSSGALICEADFFAEATERTEGDEGGIFGLPVGLLERLIKELDLLPDVSN